VASLWKVDDAATSVLMEDFYTNLWKKKLPRLEALRQAQLNVLRHPERLEERRQALRDDLAKRGLEVAEPRPLPTGGRDSRPENANRSHPQLWAAFILSGDFR
jgi:CHAT domain-containing protein